jgi:hypothetical protein
MAVIGVALAAALAGPSQAIPDKLYLTCQVSAPPAVAVAELYRVPPRDEVTMAMDLIEQGAASLMEPPPETWIVDRSQQRIEAGPGKWRWTFHNAAFDRDEIRASQTTEGGRYIAVTFNRISGTAETSFVMPEPESEAWRQKHGKPFPRTWTWTQRCTASQSQKI